MPPFCRQRGSVLVLVLGVLTLLTLFSVSFAILMSIERDASTNYQEQVRARLLARAGLERAYAELRAVSGRAASAAGDGAWAFGERRGVQLTSAECRSPSFSAGKVHPGRTPEEVRGYSSILGGTFAQSGDLYSLKIMDMASMIHVNDDNPGRRRLLLNLCTALGIADGAAVASTIDRSRPTRGYASKRQLGDMVRSALGGSNATTTWELLADHLTCYGYVPPGGGRAPVNVNTAPAAVLVALVAGLEGRGRDGKTISIDYAEGRRIVQELILPARPFADWAAFEAWLDGTGKLTPERRDLLIAALAPTAARVVGGTRLVAPADIRTPTSPLCFAPHGFFEVSASGIVYDPKDRILAEEVLTTVVRIDQAVEELGERQ